MFDESQLKDEKGNWKYTNALENELSPYLRQHAHNPVDWHPWSSHALMKAKELQKPVFLSVGYSTCYWCHVMERVIFWDERIAGLMNKFFVNIKVDREERPDIDDIYMTARQIITREGGWPNSVFLTPDLQPFFAGGTFIPDIEKGPEDFEKLIEVLHQSWMQNKEHIFHASDLITQGVQQNLTMPRHKESEESLILEFLIRELMTLIERVFDTNDGGFFQAPKFPHENFLLFLLDAYKKTQHENIEQIVDKTLGAMSSGGLFDQVEGGFHRYAVDDQWQIPHFEKMLYNQAFMSLIYACSYECFGNIRDKEIALKTVDFVIHNMMDNSGLFYSALDAETAGVEGAYYVFTPNEIEEHLTKKHYEVFQKYYDLVSLSSMKKAKKNEAGVIVLKTHDVINSNDATTIESIIKKLTEIRNSRNKPFTDKKTIAAWNAMMVYSLVRIAKILDRSDYEQKALQSAQAMIDQLVGNNGYLFRMVLTDEQGEYKLGSQPGFLEDYAWVIKALLELYDASQDSSWLDKARALMEKAELLFWDNGEDGFFSSNQQHYHLVNIKAGSDASVPSDNAVMLHNIITLYNITEDDRWSAMATKLVSVFYDDMVRSPLNYCHMIHAILKMPTLSDEGVIPSSGTMASIANDNAVSSAACTQINLVQKTNHVAAGSVLKLLLSIAIEEGYYLVRDSVDIKVKGMKYIQVQPIKLPKATHTVEDSIGKVPAYSDNLDVPINIIVPEKLPKSGKAKLRIVLELQLCRQGSCLPKDIITLQHELNF